MRGAAAIVMVLGCEGTPEVPARLEELGNLPQTGQEQPAAFDFDDTLIVMDGSSGLRRFAGGRLLTVSGSSQFALGELAVDRDGTLLVGTSNLLARLEPGDRLVNIAPSPPASFTRCTGTPSGAYHVLPFGAATTLTLPAGGAAWLPGERRIDRTLRAPDGTIYAIEDGDVVTLGPDDAPSIVASCAEFAGGACPDLELAGVDGAGHVHMAIAGLPALHVLDPVAGNYRDVVLPGGLLIADVATGASGALVLASDPARADERSLWLLPDGGEQLLRFATLGPGSDFAFAQVLVDHAGTLHVIDSGTLSKVVVP